MNEEPKPWSLLSWATSCRVCHRVCQSAVALSASLVRCIKTAAVRTRYVRESFSCVRLKHASQCAVARRLCLGESTAASLRVANSSTRKKPKSRTRHRLFPDCSGPFPESSCPCAALTPLLIPSSQESQAEQSATLHPTIPPRTVLVSRHAPPPASQPSPAAASQQQPKAAASGEQLEGNKTRSWTGSVGSFGAGIVSTSRTRHRLFPDCSAPSLEPSLCNQCRPHATLSPLLWPGVSHLAARLVARHGADKVGNRVFLRAQMTRDPAMLSLRAASRAHQAGTRVGSTPILRAHSTPIYTHTRTYAYEPHYDTDSRLDLELGSRGSIEWTPSVVTDQVWSYS